jgi:hypothetical protein
MPNESPANPKLVKMPPPPPKSPEYRHDFSPAQMDLMKVYISKLNQSEAAKAAADSAYNEMRQSIGLFIDYLQKELNLQPDVAWSLHGDDDGTPCLIGVPKIPKK